MECADFNEILEAYIDGDLSPVRCGDVEVHLAACSGCRKRLETARQIAFELRSLPVRMCPDEVAGRVRELVMRGPVSRFPHVPALFRRHPLPAWSLSMAALLLILPLALIFIVLKKSDVETPRYSQVEIDDARKGIALAFGAIDHAMHRTQAVLNEENISEKIFRPLKLKIGLKRPEHGKGGEKS